MPKSPKSESEALARLPRLPGLVLEGGKRTLGASLSEDKGLTLPQVALWVDAEQGFVRTVMFIAPGTNRDNGLTETLSALKTAFTGPFVPAPSGAKFQPGLPEKVRVADEELAGAARALLEPLGIAVEYAAELPAFEEAFQLMAEGLGEDEDEIPLPPYEWEIDQNLLTALFRAADAYSKQAPWTYMPDNPPLEIRLGEHGPQAEVPTIYASILGGAEIVQGVAFYNSLADYYKLVELGFQHEEKEEEEPEPDLEQELEMLQQMGAPVDQMSRQEALAMLADLREAEKGADLIPGLEDCLTFWLDERDSVDPGYLEWLAERGLKYTRHQRVPIFSRVLAGGDGRMPDAREAEALRLSIEGLTQFFQKYSKQLKTGMAPVEGFQLEAHPAGGAAIEVKFPASTYDQAHFEELARQEAASGKAFNIYELVFDHASGEYMEDKAQSYQTQLLALFSESPEGQSLSEQEPEVMGWADTMLKLGIGDLGVTPAQMAPAQFRELLFEVFPRKVLVEPGEAPQIVQELRAFWQFLERAFSLPNAAGCLNVLNEQAAERLKAELAAPDDFGKAQPFLAEGLERGFDMSTPAGMNAWVETYKADLAGLPAVGKSLSTPGKPKKAASGQKKAKRKME
jgi:hypothetical protein